MVNRLKIFRSVIAAPVLCLSLLAAMTVEQRHHIPPADVAGYHQAVKAQIENGVPRFIGQWTGTDIAIPDAAQKLLHLNAYVSRRYVDNDPNDLSRRSRSANLLIVQCGDSSDMDGHWPPNCYPAQGQTEEFHASRRWTVNGLDIPLVEYHFVHPDEGRTARICVYNFLIVPGRGIQRSMDEVRKAASNYRERFYGAAQLQVIVDGDLPQSEREAIFMELVSPITNVIRAINTTGGPS